MQRLVLRFLGEQFIKINIPEGFNIGKGQCYETYDTVRFPSVLGTLMIRMGLPRQYFTMMRVVGMLIICTLTTGGGHGARCSAADVVPNYQTHVTIHSQDGSLVFKICLKLDRHMLGGC